MNPKSLGSNDFFKRYSGVEKKERCRQLGFPALSKFLGASGDNEGLNISLLNREAGKKRFS